MKKILICLAIVLGTLVVGNSVQAEDLVYAQIDAYYNYDEAYKLMDLINEYRVNNGLSRLETNDKLMKIAMQRALECNVYFKHDSPTNKGMHNAVYTLGFAKAPYIEAGTVVWDPESKKFSFNESITGSYNGAENALENWKNSPAHNDHILNKGDALNDKQFAIGVGFVNNTAVTCIFHSTEALGTDNNTRLTNYSKVEILPILKSVYENGKGDKNTSIPWDKSIKFKILSNPNQVDFDDKDQKDDKKSDNKTNVIDAKIKKVSDVKLTRKKSGKNTKITVKFSKVKGCKYQIQVANNKKFKSAKKSSISSNRKTVSVKYKGKKAYVRVRCYKKINGKTVYGKWSSIKSIKTYK